MDGIDNRHCDVATLMNVPNDFADVGKIVNLGATHKDIGDM